MELVKRCNWSRSARSLSMSSWFSLDSHTMPYGRACMTSWTMFGMSLNCSDRPEPARLVDPLGRILVHVDVVHEPQGRDRGHGRPGGLDRSLTVPRRPPLPGLAVSRRGQPLRVRTSAHRTFPEV